MVLENTLESFLDRKKIKSINPKGNQPWMFIGRTNAEAEVPILLATWCEELALYKRPWCWKILKAGKKGNNRGWNNRGTIEMVGWHHWLNAHEFEQAPGVDDGQVILVCCSPWGHKESDMTEWLNWTQNKSPVLGLNPTMWLVSGSHLQRFPLRLYWLCSHRHCPLQP